MMSFSHIFRMYRVLCLKWGTPRTTCVGFYSSKPPREGIVKEIDPDTGTFKTKKAPVIPKITLMSGDSITVTTLEEAHKLSRRRDLKLVKMLDADLKTHRPVYQLMTGAEYHAEDLKQREKAKLDRQQRDIKGEKVLFINSKIAKHDLEVQLRKAAKWIKKKYEVRVVITGGGGNVEACEKVYDTVEHYFKIEECNAKLVQKRSQGSDIKFQIIPPKYKANVEL